MKRFMLVSLLLVAVGCSDNKVTIPDNQDDIDRNAAEIELLKASDALQDLRLDALESRVDDLEARMASAEDAIDSNEEKLSELCETVSYHEEWLSELSREFRRTTRELRQADRETRRLLRKKVSNLRAKLLREIRQRQLADADLQEQLDGLERTVRRNTARQAMINRFLAYGLYQAHNRIDQLQARIQRALRDLRNRVGILEGEVDNIQSNIRRLARSIRSVSLRVDGLEDNMISVEEQCDGEYLLNTPDGLFGIGYETRRVTERFRVGDSVRHFICDRFSYFSPSTCIKGRNVTTTVSDSESVSFDVIDDVFLTPAEESTCEEER